MTPTRDNALDHVVLVLFENRSFDNLLGRLYAPGDVEAFEGVIGKDLSNPIPAWAEHGAEGGVVPYGVSASMDAPDPDPGEEFQHTNTQLFNVLNEANRFKDATEMVAPHNAPPAGTESTMEGFVTDYISFLTFELGRQPTYEEYSQIMTGYTPEQVPVISALARGFGVFDHWFSEVPVADPGQPVLLDGGDVIGFRGQPAGHQLHAPQHGGDDLQSPGALRENLEGLRARARPHLLHRVHPHGPLTGALRHELRPVRPVRGRRRRRHVARFQPD